MVFTFLIAALAACGIFLVTWSLLEAFVMKLPSDSVHVFYLNGSDAEVEQKMRACLWMRNRHGLRGKVFFIDDGLSVQAQITAQLMLGNDETAIFCSKEQFLDYIRKE